MPACSPAVRLALLSGVTALLVAGSMLLGPTPLRWTDVIAGWRADAAERIFWQLRVPRTLLAACAGAGLAVGGVVFQALFRNPLAEPYTLGIASGASLAAAIGFLAGSAGPLGRLPLTGLAFGGAAAAMLVVFLLSRIRADRDPARLLLAGVCVAYLSSAGVLLVTFLANRAVTNDIVRWMMGSLVALELQPAGQVALVLLPTLALLLAAHRALDLLHFGDELAATRGVAVGRTRWGAFLLVGLLTAVIVAHCGPIGFVGLMVPHMARALVGVRTGPLLIAAALGGAAFLAVCDGVARAVRPVELPVGVVTNILGAAFFFYLLATRDVLHGAVRR